MKAGIDYIGVTTPFYCTDGKGNFVMLKRTNMARDEAGRWDFGGGQVAFGESLEDAVLREAKEEYGCNGEIIEQLPAHSVKRTFKKAKTHWVAIPFFIKVDPKKVKIMEAHKFSALGWFRLNNLPKPLHSGVKFTIKRYGKYFEKYA